MWAQIIYYSGFVLLFSYQILNLTEFTILRLLDCINRALQQPYDPENCPFIFDSWSCFNSTSPGVTQTEQCPNFVNLGFNQARKAEKSCMEDGDWWVHPDSNKTWTNYTTCLDLVDVNFRQTINKITVTGTTIITLILISVLLITFPVQL